MVLFTLLTIIPFFTMDVYADNCSTCKDRFGIDLSEGQADKYGHMCEMEEPYKCPICGYYHDMASLGSFNKTAYDMQCIIQGGSTVDGTLETILKFDVTDDSNEMGESFVKLWGRGESFYTSLAVIGELLCIVYGLIDMMGKVQLSQLDGEQVFKCFIKIIIGVIIIRTGYQIITAALGIATIVFSRLQYGATASPSGTSCIYDKISDMNFLDALLSAANNVLPWIVMMVATVLLQLVVWARILDLMVRVAFAPIGMADIMYGGMSSNGVKYLKKIVSASIQGAVLLAMLISYGTILAKVNSSGFHPMLNIILSFTLISTLFKAKDFADSMLGV